MKYYLCTITDLGYEDLDGNALESIEGMDNVTQKFRHRGYANVPSSAVQYHQNADNLRVFALYEDGVTPEDPEAVEINKAAALSTLELDFGVTDVTLSADGRLEYPDILPHERR